MEWQLLAALPEADRRQLLSVARRRRFGRNEVIFHEGDPGESLHLVLKGHVAIRVTTPLGETATLTVLHAGDTFGELALLGEDNTRSATAVALEPAETFTLTRGQFDELRRTHPGVERLLAGVLARQVRRLTGHLLEALYVPAEKRILRQLAALAEDYDSDGEDAAVVGITQEDLATMAGTTRPTVNRVLRDMQEAGALHLARRRIQILDREALDRRAR